MNLVPLSRGSNFYFSRRGQSRTAAVLVFLLLAIGLSGCSLFGARSLPPHFHYTVQRGDTLYKLAQEFGVSLDALVDINDIDDPHALQIGQIVRIPSGGKPPPRKTPTPEVHRDKKPDQKSVKTIKLSAAKKYIGNLATPVRGATLSSLFGPRWNNFHEGLDFSAPKGTPIYAAHDGVVVYSDDRLRGYGHLVIVRGDGLLTVYAHNRRNLVDQGDRVRKGEQIAEMGNSGKATGVHLHFETRVRNKDGKYVAVDPLAFYPKQ